MQRSIYLMRCVLQVTVPVIGGHAGTTIVPLLSQVQPKVSFTDAEVEALTQRIMFGGDEVVKVRS
jgi:malate dehydrogenase